MKYLFAIMLMTASLSAHSQADSIEIWRHLGFESMKEGDLENAIRYYSKIHELHREDYDARLALARLYARSGNCERAMDLYGLIYTNDSTDVEAMNGYARCYLRQDRLEEAIAMAERALDYLPGHVPQYLLLARAYAWAGRLEEAIETYENALAVDATWAEIWAGLGRMHYWKNKPFSALRYYRKALELDPHNQQVMEDYFDILGETSVNVKAGFRFVEEVEESYDVRAYIQQYGLYKRVDDRIGLGLNFLLDRSNRDFNSTESDIWRWFDNTWAKFDYHGGNHKISGYGGYSVSDAQATTYGLSWNFKTALGKVKLENTLDAGYDYFYYWNEVGRTGLSESLDLRLGRFRANASLLLGEVDEKDTQKFRSEPFEKRHNPYLGYAISLDIALIKVPELRIGGRYSWLDYDYQSPGYYSPYDRKLTGATASLIHKGKDWYLYAGGSYTPGEETFRFKSGPQGQEVTEGTIDITNWTAGLELGFTFDPFTLSFGASRFDNPFYRATTAYVSVHASL